MQLFSLFNGSVQSSVTYSCTNVAVRQSAVLLLPTLFSQSTNYTKGTEIKQLTLKSVATTNSTIRYMVSIRNYLNVTTLWSIYCRNIYFSSITMLFTPSRRNDSILFFAAPVCKWDSERGGKIIGSCLTLRIPTRNSRHLITGIVDGD